MLCANEARLYLLPEAAPTPSQRALFASWLTDEERTRWQRFHFEADQTRYLLTRALVRSVLSTSLRQPPQRLSFVENQYGKPSLHEASLHFNVSHTRGMIAMLVSPHECGVDVESINRRSDSIVQIADRFFSSREVAALHQLPTEAQRARFFTYWTLKESYIKARGMGLSLPLEKFAFVELSPIRLEVEAEIEDGVDWSFTLRSFEDFLIATATIHENNIVEKTVHLEDLTRGDEADEIC